jgi:hypothetical protein
LGQLDSLRIPARIAAPKLIASFVPRPATSFGLMLSLAVVVVATTVSVAGVPGLAAVGSVDGELSAAGEPVVPAGVGVAATSPPLTPERGESVTQAERTASETTPRRVERT